MCWSSPPGAWSYKPVRFVRITSLAPASKFVCVAVCTPTSTEQYRQRTPGCWSAGRKFGYSCQREGSEGHPKTSALLPAHERCHRRVIHRSILSHRPVKLFALICHRGLNLSNPKHAASHALHRGKYLRQEINTCDKRSSRRTRKDAEHARQKPRRPTWSKAIGDISLLLSVDRWELDATCAEAMATEERGSRYLRQ